MYCWLHHTGSLVIQDLNSCDRSDDELERKDWRCQDGHVGMGEVQFQAFLK